MPRHTIVRELNAEDLERIEKIKKDAACVFASESVLWGCACIVVIESRDDSWDVPDEVRKYLIILLILNVTFSVLKFLLGYSCAMQRRAGRTEWYQVGM